MKKENGQKMVLLRHKTRGHDYHVSTSSGTDASGMPQVCQFCSNFFSWGTKCPEITGLPKVNLFIRKRHNVAGSGRKFETTVKRS